MQKRINLCAQEFFSALKKKKEIQHPATAQTKTLMREMGRALKCKYSASILLILEAKTVYTEKRQQNGANRVCWMEGGREVWGDDT